MNALRLLPVPALADNYVWIAADASGAALVVDPGDAGPVRETLRREGLRLGAILATHHHPDHVGGIAALVAGSTVPVFAPHDERIALATRRVGDGDTIRIGEPDLCFDVVAVPGHTRTHVAYHGHGLLFCGDTLFSVGCGGLFEGTPEQMLASLERLARLPGTTRVCCGHEYTLVNCAFARTLDPRNEALAEREADVLALRAAGKPSLPSTLAVERACNPFLRIDAPALVAALAAETGPDATRTERFAALRRRKDAFRMPAP
jgi:hydroxyacylglutathione hydrolase